jgi:ribose-phosphate pyrophosphokinase
MKKYNYTKWLPVSDQKYVLNLDPKFQPLAKNDLYQLEHKSFTFPGGEPQLQILSKVTPGEVAITHRVNSIADFFEIVMANDALRRMGFKNIDLVLPYFPAARQDRVCNEGEPLTIKLFADMVNNCGFNNVVIFTPHSEVTPALLNNVTIVDELSYIEKVLCNALPKKTDTVINIVCPDAGAGKRVQKVVQHLTARFPQNTVDLIRCEKIRDVKDGSLKGFFVDSEDLNGTPCLLVDDIVSYGGTFLGLADKLREKNCGKLMIFTSHADCQAGIDNLLKKFDHVYTTNSKHDFEPNDRLTVFPFEL